MRFWTETTRAKHWAILLALTLGAVLVPRAALATEYVNCSRDQQFAISKAATAAIEALDQAIGYAVADSPQFVIWFGPWSQTASKRVTSALTATRAKLMAGSVDYYCLSAQEGACPGGTFAFVNQAREYRVNLCPPFFGQPEMTDMLSVARGSRIGTRGGTIVHEMTHFYSILGTEDHCYARDICTSMARTQPELALMNADSYQYFVEDAFFKGRN